MALNPDGWRLDLLAIISPPYPPISATFRLRTHPATPVNTPPKTGSASPARKSSVAVSWTSTCSTTSTTPITLSPSVSGNYYYAIPLFPSCIHSLIHSSPFSISDLSFWCFSCDAYLDAQLIPQLRPIHQLAYVMKFGESPPLPLIQQHQPSSAR